MANFEEEELEDLSSYGRSDITDTSIDDEDLSGYGYDDVEDLSAYGSKGSDYDYGGYSSDWTAAKHLLTSRQGRGGLATSEAFKRLTGFEAPDWLSDVFTGLKESGEEGIKGWNPDYPGGVLEADSTLGWMGEQTVTQAGETGLLYGLGILDELFGKKVRGLSTVLRSGGIAAIFNPIHDEALNEIAHKNGKSVEDLTEGEKNKAAIAAGINTFLETLVPFGGKKWKKGMPTLKGKSVQKDAKSIEKWLKTVDKDKLPSQGKQLLSGLLKRGVGEAITEKAEGAVTSMFSDPGLAYEFTPEGISEGASQIAGGFAGGTTFGGPSAISEARSFNKTIEEGKRVLERINNANKFQASEDYITGVNKMSGKFGPIPDTIPEQYDIPTSPDSKFKIPVFNDVIEVLKSRGFGRSATDFQNALNKAKTGSEVNDLMNSVYGSFTGTETMSGEKQGKKSFNVAKQMKIKEYSDEFQKIQSKWSRGLLGLTKGRYLMGEMGERVAPDVDNYFGDFLTGKFKKNKKAQDKAESALMATHNLSREDITELRKDANKLNKIRNNIHKDLNKILKSSGLSLGFTENYLTRGIDKKSVKNNEEEFMTFLKTLKNKDGTNYSHQKAVKVFNDILNGKDPVINSSRDIKKLKNMPRKGKPKSPFEKARSKQWDKLDDKFRLKSPLASMQDYLSRAAIRAASAETFGGKNAEKFSGAIDRLLKNEVLSPDEAQRAWDMYDAEHNIYQSPKTKIQRLGQDMSRRASTVAAVSLLGLASVASLTEPMWIPGRLGYANTLKGLPTLAGYALKGMKNTMYSGKMGKEVDIAFGRSILNIMGLAINHQQNEKVEMLMSGDYNPVLNIFFRTPGGLFLTQYTNAVRTWTASAALHMFQDQANKLTKGKLKGNKLLGLKRELRENGMTLDDFKQIVRLGKGKIDIMDDNWLDTRFKLENGTEVSVRDMIVPWMKKATSDVALEPHVGNRPLWMSDPRFRLFSQLKSFPILFGNTIMKRTMKQLNPKVCTPAITGAVQVLGSVAMALAMAHLVVGMKDAIRHVDKDRTIFDDFAALGVPHVFDIKQPSDVMSIPALSVGDKFVKWFIDIFDSEESTAEDLIETIMKATFGTIFSEAVFDE